MGHVVGARWGCISWSAMGLHQLERVGHVVAARCETVGADMGFRGFAQSVASCLFSILFISLVK